MWFGQYKKKGFKEEKRKYRWLPGKITLTSLIKLITALSEQNPPSACFRIYKPVNSDFLQFHTLKYDTVMYETLKPGYGSELSPVCVMDFLQNPQKKTCVETSIKFMGQNPTAVLLNTLSLALWAKHQQVYIHWSNTTTKCNITVSEMYEKLMMKE